MYYRFFCLSSSVLIISSSGILPPSQFRNSPNKNSREKTGHPKLDDLFAHARLHFRHRNIRQNKPALLITMTAIHRTSGSIRVAPATLFIPFQRHPTTLTVFVRLIHQVRLCLNLVFQPFHLPGFEIINGGKNTNIFSKVAKFSLAPDPSRHKMGILGHR